MPGHRIVVQIDGDLEPLIPGFLERREEEIANLGEALAAGDYEQIRFAGHSLKGTGGAYGFHDLSAMGRWNPSSSDSSCAVYSRPACRTMMACWHWFISPMRRLFRGWGMR